MQVQNIRTGQWTGIRWRQVTNSKLLASVNDIQLARIVARDESVLCVQITIDWSIQEVRIPPQFDNLATEMGVGVIKGEWRAVPELARTLGSAALVKEEE